MSINSAPCSEEVLVEMGDPEETPPPPRRFVRWLAWRLLLLVFLTFLGFGVFLDIYGQVDQAAPAQAIVILGAGVAPGGLPGDSLRARTLHAVTLYKRHFAPVIICTGGLGDYPPTEAEVATRLAVTCGVPDGVIYPDATSTSTRENAVNAAAICRTFNWRRVIIVSDPYHLWRARRDFLRAGLLPYPSPATDCLRNRQLPLRLLWTVREELLILRDVISGQ